jgi:hypothetical protein
LKGISFGRIVFLLLVVINVSLAFYSTPVVNYSDSDSYIALSKQILTGNIDQNLSHRSPLYSIILAGFLKISDEPGTLKAMIYLNYFLLFGTSLIIYSLFRRIFINKYPALLITVAFNLSLPAIFFANLLLTEIPTVFLLAVTIYLLIKFHETGRPVCLVFMGLSAAFLALARFNAVPIVLAFLILICYLLLVYKAYSFKRWLFTSLFFVIPCLLLLNIWAVYNYNRNGFYGLFPGSGTIINRNVIVASINKDNKVSAEYQPVLDIFLKAKVKYAGTPVEELKGSIRSKYKTDILRDMYSGFPVYSIAYPELVEFFKVQNPEVGDQLDKELGGFYKEILHQNSGFIRKVRIYSFLSGFRASASGVLSSEYGRINLNILPAFIIKLNKLIFPFISFVVFVSFFFFAGNLFQNRNLRPDFVLLTLFIIIFSFWGINFIFVTAADANRFKFPAEPFIIGLFVYYATKIANFIFNRAAATSGKNLKG